jgi:hypothetical protein
MSHAAASVFTRQQLQQRQQQQRFGAPVGHNSSAAVDNLLHGRRTLATQALPVQQARQLRSPCSAAPRWRCRCSLRRASCTGATTPTSRCLVPPDRRTLTSRPSSMITSTTRCTSPSRCIWSSTLQERHNFSMRRGPGSVTQPGLSQCLVIDQEHFTVACENSLEHGKVRCRIVLSNGRCHTPCHTFLVHAKVCY